MSGPSSVKFPQTLSICSGLFLNIPQPPCNKFGLSACTYKFMWVGQIAETLGVSWSCASLHYQGAIFKWRVPATFLMGLVRESGHQHYLLWRPQYHAICQVFKLREREVYTDFWTCYTVLLWPSIKSESNCSIYVLAQHH